MVSAARYAAYGTRMLMAISIGPSSMRRSNQSTTTARTRPTARPPPAEGASRHATVPAEGARAAAGQERGPPPNPSGRRRPGAGDQPYRDLKREQPGRVVREALPFQRLADPPGKPRSPCDGCRSDGVRRRHHRAEDEPGAPVEPWDDQRRSEGDAENREDDEAHSQRDDADEVVRERRPGREPRRRVDERRQDDEEH